MVCCAVLRPRRPAALLATIACVTSIMLETNAVASPEAWPPQTFADAQLNDVVFVDAQHGWAVGDRGVIWHSDDAGRHWQLQNSGVACSLYSVCFVDHQVGWAVGGWTHPYTHKTTGVTLHTKDGGLTWVREPSTMTPTLKRVKFFDPRNGWAIGNSSAVYPTGIFRTSDGGRNWIPLTSGRRQGWLTGDFPDPRGGAVAGRSGALATLMKNQMQTARTPSLGQRPLRCLRLSGQHDGWLVGDRGLALQTTDAGLNWQTPPTDLPEGISNQFDFYAIALYREHCWIAGAPGSCVSHSADGGDTWDVYPTGQNLPIHSLTFSDENHGWAVGAMGTILATDDGGKTWRLRQSGGSRAALLGLYGEPTSPALEVFVQLCGAEGYLGVAHFIGARDAEIVSDDRSSLAERTHQALISSGASSASSDWRFPLRQAGLHLSADRIIAGWDRANDGRGLANLRESIVRVIRQWRPDVILTDRFDSRSEDPLAQMISQIVLTAVEEAADPAVYSEQITVARLQPWQVKKVFGSMADGRQGTINVLTSKLAQNLGRSLADYSSAPRGLIGRHQEPSPPSIGFQLLISRLPHDVGRSSFFSGLILNPGGEARRSSGNAPHGNLKALQKAAQRRRNVEQILARAKSDPTGAATFQTQINDLTRGLNDNAAGDILDRMARNFHTSGRGALAADTFELLVDRYPKHPHAEAALVWLIQYYSSGEATWRERAATQFTNYVGRAVPEKPSPNDPFNPQRKAQPPTSRFQKLVGLDRSVASTSGRQQRASRALALSKIVQRSRPSLFSEPMMRFPLATAQTTVGLPLNAERFYQHLSSSVTDDAWSTCAKAELWMRDQRGLSPKPVYHGARTADKPHLDGQLDEPIWKLAKPIPLRSALTDDAQWEAVAMLAYDREFLYLAVSCRKAEGVEYPTTGQPRTYDSDLSRQDRVDLLIDVDRDYSSYYRLTVDHRGWTGEACLGDKTWNPQWSVAASSDEQTWVVEAAIAWSELTPQPPEPGQAWALGIQRVAPGVGFQSWTQPSAVEIQPQGFGLLIFE